MRPYLIIGAGAVGSSLGAYLARGGHPVTLVTRPAHAEAIETQGGLRTVSRTESFLAPVEGLTAIPSTRTPDTVLFLTVQSPEVAATIRELGPSLRHLPMVTWQNGIRSEEVVAPHVSHLYGGVVRFTSTLLEPGEVRLRAPGQLILGRYPKGIDPLVTAVAEELAGVGFQSATSPEIQADKALKLLVNLVSGPPVLLRRTGKEPVLAAVQVAILEEARRVFDRAGVRAWPASGIGQTLDTMLVHFRAGGSAPDTSGKIFNSTWQNLHHRRHRLENDYYHGEIVRLGHSLGEETPVNQRVLEMLEDVQARGLGPEPFDVETFRAGFADLVRFPDPDTNAGGSNTGDEMEI